MEKFRQYKNYGIIAVLSIFCLFFLPFTGSVVGLGFVLPTTAAGWFVFVTTKLIIGGVNILILYCFCEQGKFNIRNDEHYLAAKQILLKESNSKELLPKSPAQHSREVYGKKGITIFLTTILGTLALTQAVLTFDAIVMLTYLFTIIMGIVFGIIQMGYEEIYWTEDYYKYALLIKERSEKEAEKKREEAMALAAAEPTEPPNDTPDTSG